MVDTNYLNLKYTFWSFVGSVDIPSMCKFWMKFCCWPFCRFNYSFYLYTYILYIKTS